MRSRLQIISTGVFGSLCLILLFQLAASHELSIPERSVPGPALHDLPFEFGPWKAAREDTMEDAVREFLSPDDYILRDYVNQADGTSVNFFVAYFKSIQNGFGPHSPRYCLPGTGWLERSSEIVSIPVPRREQGIPVNKYLLEKSNERILVVYWYQNDRDLWAEEFRVKLRFLPDLIRYRRSDVSIVRLVTPVAGVKVEREFARCVEFAKLAFPSLVERLASGDRASSESASSGGMRGQ